MENKRGVLNLYRKESVGQIQCRDLKESFKKYMLYSGPPLWSSGQSFWLQIQRSRVRFPALLHFLSSSGFGTESTQPHEVN
jgi:hypothetical protein